MDINNNLGYLLHHLGTALDRQSDLLLQDKFGLGFSQFKIMLALKQKDGVQQKQIAHTLGQTEASISRQIKLLVNMGLVSSKKIMKTGARQLLPSQLKAVTLPHRRLHPLKLTTPLCFLNYLLRN